MTEEPVFAHVHASDHARAAGRDYFEVHARPCPGCQMRWLLEDQEVCIQCANRAAAQRLRDGLALALFGWLICFGIVDSIAKRFGANLGLDAFVLALMLEVGAIFSWQWWRNKS